MKRLTGSRKKFQSQAKLNENFPNFPFFPNFYSFQYAGKNCLVQVRAAANKDPGRLLLLHQWGTDRKAGPRRPLRLHGSINGGGHQVRAANDQQPRGHEGGNTYRGCAGRRPWPEAVAVRRVQQGRRVGQQDGEQRNGGVRINLLSDILLYSRK